MGVLLEAALGDVFRLPTLGMPLKIRSCLLVQPREHGLGVRRRHLLLTTRVLRGFHRLPSLGFGFCFSLGVFGLKTHMTGSV